MEWLTADDKRLTWHNVEELHPVEDGLRVQRVVEEWRKRFPEGAAWRALQSANVFLRFQSDADQITVRWRNIDPPPPPDQERTGEVFCNGKELARFQLLARQERAFTSPGGGLWEVHFPWAASVVFQGLGVDDGCRVSPEKAEGPPKVRWLAYGDSITQGFTSYSGTGTWVWIASQLMGVEPINMGFGGAAFGEEIIAHYVASRPDWDLLTLTFGINNFGNGDTAAGVAAKYERFLDIVREAHPDKPVQCITPIITLPWDVEGEPTPRGESVQAFRDAIADGVNARMATDSHLYLVNGLDCVGDAGGLEDVVHPNNLGMRWFGKKVAEAWAETGGDTRRSQ